MAPFNPDPHRNSYRKATPDFFKNWLQVTFFPRRSTNTVAAKLSLLSSLLTFLLAEKNGQGRAGPLEGHGWISSPCAAPQLGLGDGLNGEETVAAARS